MNINFDLTYLSGGDQEYGPNFGGATVRTLTRKGYKAECPNVTKLLENLHFDIDYENKGMNEIMTNGAEAPAAARKMIAENPGKLTEWLKDVKTFDGGNGYEAVKATLLSN
jgi:glycine betaine/proline transport system substrate-binding protein